MALDLSNDAKVHVGIKKHVLEFQNADSELQAFYKSYVKALK